MLPLNNVLFMIDFYAVVVLDMIASLFITSPMLLEARAFFPGPVHTFAYVKPMFLSRGAKVRSLLKRAVLQFRIRLVIFLYTEGKT